MNLRGIVVMGSTYEPGGHEFKSNSSHFLIFLHFIHFKLAITFLRKKMQTTNPL